ncbi:MAG: DNA-directed DNA polymerase II small subunit [Candidatus Ranarchaeia archaeon]
MEQEISDALKKFISAGFQVAPDIIDILKTIQKVNQFTEDTIKILLELPEKPVIINKEVLNKLVGPSLSLEEEKTHDEIEEKKELKKSAPDLPSSISVFKPLAKEYDPQIEIIKDASSSIAKSINKSQDYIDYFRDRFKRLRRILNQHPEISGRTNIKESKKNPKNTEVVIIGMVKEKRTTVAGNQLVIIEDLDDEILCIISKKNDALVNGLKRLLIDQVVAFRGKIASSDMMFAEELIYPDVPMRVNNKGSDVPLCSVLLSDLHIGSKEFLESYFRRFILWLNGKIGDEKQKELAGKVKYILIAGDIVDGVGIYPRQEDELTIKDIYKQYEEVGKFIQQLPDYISTIMIPGNHDAVRAALPQPAIEKKFIQPILDSGNILSLGNPSQVKIHNVNFFICHGTSLNTAIGQLPGVNFSNSHLAMKELLKGRHIAPVWGSSAPIAPEPRDWLVIDEVPQVFHAGHIHVNALSKYRGSWIVNSGTFQAQTSYMKMAGIEPTPGTVSLVDLQEINIQQLAFN